MSYLDIISLSDAKTYLRIDDDLNDDDLQIESMIKSALSYLERRTNHILYSRDKTYLFQEGELRVYDYPINSVTDSDGYKSYKNVMYTLYEADNISTKTLTANVGYTDVSDVPQELINAGLYLIKIYYYEAETDKANKGDLPSWLNDTINQYKRFIF